MKRRNFIVTVAAILGGGKLGLDMMLPDGPSPQRDDIEILEKGLDVDTPPGTEDVGNGYAYVRFKNTADFPIKVSVKFELLKDGHPFTYAYEHSKRSVLAQPGEERTLVDTWTVEHFPDSTEATGVRIASLSLKNANKLLIGGEPEEE